MKRFLSALLLLGVALAAPSSTTFKSGVFFATAGTDAKVRFEFKFEPSILFNRAGQSIISLETPWAKIPVEIKVEKGTPYKELPEEYHAALEPVAVALRIPAGTKAGIYPIKLSSEVFLCDNQIKVCYIDRAVGSFEVRVGAGKDAPVLVEFNRPTR